MAGKNKLCPARKCAGNARRYVIACDVCVNDLDLIFANEPGHSVCAEDTERVPYRHMKNVGRWKKIQAVLPYVRRPQGHEYIVSFLLQAAAQVDKMPFAAAVRPRR